MSLRQIIHATNCLATNCPVTQNVNELNVNTLFGCFSQCLQLITGNKELPTRLPPNISTRFKFCGELAQLCQVVKYLI